MDTPRKQWWVRVHWSNSEFDVDCLLVCDLVGRMGSAANVDSCRSFELSSSELLEEAYGEEERAEQKRWLVMQAIRAAGATPAEQRTAHMVLGFHQYRHWGSLSLADLAKHLNISKSAARDRVRSVEQKVQKLFKLSERPSLLKLRVLIDQL